MVTLTLSPSTIIVTPYAGYVRVILRFPLNEPSDRKLSDFIVWMVNQLRESIQEIDPAAHEDNLLTTVRLHKDTGIEIRITPESVSVQR